MRLINIEAFMKREELMDKAWRAVTDHQTDVLKFCDETTKYAILSHRWDDPTEISYEEMVDLGKIGRAKRNKIRQRRGYTKILKTCMQAKKDGYSWVWIDTCCIDKRSSAELSEAINSMYRWYENSSVCYAYLHDVDGSFPTKKDDQEYKLNGWPEWFSRGWTLQEMVASRNVRFFDKNWKFIGDKKEHAKMLQDITQVPQRILVDGLSGNRPCVAQIISWAANRRTTRIEDKAYSLMGLLEVNMPMLYGEGKKAFHRLQLEIIRSSDDQSIFAWCNEAKMRPGSILAEDPSFFKHCSEMELMGYDEFIKALKENIRDLPSIDRNHLGTFPITNRGIQIWMLLRPYRNSDTDFQAWLPCRNHQSASPATINLALRNYNYYRYPCSMHGSPTEDALQFSQVFLRYQDAPSDNVTFEIDDSALADNDFTCCDLHPEELKGNTLTLTGATPLCARVYSNSQGDLRFTVTFRQFFSQGWVHATSDPTGKLSEYCNQESVKGPESMQSMAEVPSRGERYGRIWVNHVRLHSTWIVRVSRVVWERNRIGVRVDAFKDTDFNIGLDKWRILDVEGINNPVRDIRGLMVRGMPCECAGILRVDGVVVRFSLAPDGTKLGDYGYFTDSGSFSCKGNIFDKCSIPEEHRTPRVHQVSLNLSNSVVVDGLALPSNHDFNTSLASLSSQFIDAYLVTMTAQCTLDAFNNSGPSNLCTFAKPFVWHR